MSTKSPFRTDPDGDGVAERFRWGRVVSVFLGVIFGTAGIRLADIVGALVEIPLSLLEAAVDLAARFASLVFVGPLAFINTGVQEAIEFVTSLGILGFVAALALVVGTAILAARARGVAS